MILEIRSPRAGRRASGTATSLLVVSLVKLAISQGMHPIFNDIIVDAGPTRHI